MFHDINFMFFQQCKIQLSNYSKLQILIGQTKNGLFQVNSKIKGNNPLIMIYNFTSQQCYRCQQVSIWSTYLLSITLQVLEKSMPSLIDLSQDFQEKCIYFSVVDSCHSWFVIWQGDSKKIFFFICVLNFQMTISLQIETQLDVSESKNLLNF